MGRLLLRVEDSFALKLGLVLEPSLPVSEARREPFVVRLRRPDGSELAARATVEIAHARNRGSWGAVRLLDGVDKAATPRGTEVWVDDDEAG